MSIAEKLKTVAENEEKVYKAGEHSGLTEAASSITNGFTSYTYLFYKNPSPSFSEEFFACFKNAVDLSQMFSACPNMTKAPYFDTSKVKKFNYMFSSCSALVDVPVYDTSSTESFYYMFGDCTGLKKAPKLNTTGATEFKYMFAYCESLETVEELDISGGTSFTYLFRNCYALKNLTIKGSINASLELSQSTKLTHESLMSVINALTDTSELDANKTYKLTIGSTNLGKLTTEEQAIITNKGWTIA